MSSGRIAVGSDADIVIWNPKETQTVSAKTHNLVTPPHPNSVIYCLNIHHTLTPPFQCAVCADSGAKHPGGAGVSRRGLSGDQRGSSCCGRWKTQRNWRFRTLCSQEGFPWHCLQEDQSPKQGNRPADWLITDQLTDLFCSSLFVFNQMAEARGVPRGNYDGPVHDVISMTKSVPPTPTSRGPPCPKTQTGPRNLHQSGFTLAGRSYVQYLNQLSDYLKLIDSWGAFWVKTVFIEFINTAVRCYVNDMMRKKPGSLT